MTRARLSVVLLLLVVALGLQASAAAAKPALGWSQPEFVAAGPSPSLFPGAEDISCAGVSLCVMVGREGRFLYSTDPTGGIDAWTETQVSDPSPSDLIAVSCPTVDFCGAVDDAGSVFISQDPEQGAWIEIALGAGTGLTDIACSSAAFCVAGDEAGNVFVSEDPGEGTAAWEETELEADGRILSVSCAGPSLCVVAADDDTFVSTNPVAGTWSSTGLDNVRDVSCPSASFCAATTFDGILVSDEPAGGAGAWTESPGSTISAGLISCPSAAFCVTVDIRGRTSTSNDPGGADPGWNVVALRSGDASGLTCTSSDFCAMALFSGDLLTSTDPDAGAAAWDYTAISGGGPALASADCPTPTLCLVAGPRGTLYTSTEPTVPGNWTATRITDGRLDQVECSGPEWCIARAANRTLLYSTDPTGGPGAWSSVSMPFAFDVTCPEDFFCAAVDGSDEVLMSSEPLAGADTWTALDLELPPWRLGPNELREVSCAFWGLCAVGGDVGTVVTSANPLAGKSAWHPWFVGNPADFHNGAGPNIDGLDCPTWSFCAATMWSGTIATTLDPANPPVPWSFESTDASFFRAVSCSYEGGLCVAASRSGPVVSALDGTSGDPDWSAPEPLAHEGLEDVSCAPEDAFCLVVDDQGYVTVGTVEEESSSGPHAVIMPPASSAPVADEPLRRKRCRAKGVKAGRLAIGGAIPLSSAGRQAMKRCLRRA